MKTSAEVERINFQGIPVIIEWPKGSTRRGVNPDGTQWSNKMYADYGHISTKNKKPVPVIEEFLKHYEREVDYYAEAAEIAKEDLENALQAAGIRAFVTSRPKAPKRLRKKLYRRYSEKHYKTFRDIYKDIVDLAGVRVSLYLPADREAVSAIIDEIFEPARPAKHFPEDRGPGDGMGYVATHHLVRLKPDLLDGSHRRYSETKIEIQVASVLMHAWAEVTHDLIYKPEKGDLSPDERVLLDQLNTLVRGGEEALNQLQTKIEGRTDKDLRFELVGSLRKEAAAIVATKGISGDGEDMDVYLGDNYDAPYAYVIEQLKDGQFDEYKAMLGFNSLEEARQVYLKHFPTHPNWWEESVDGIYEVPMNEFRETVENHA